MMPSSSYNWALKATIFSIVLFGTLFAQTTTVPLYRVFELSLTNDTAYDNKFIDVELTATYTSPSGRTFDFLGFFDGDGDGGGDYQNGNVWKLRFMPNELGEWTYEYSWSDTTAGGSGTINCIVEGAGKGIIQAYKDNPRWFAYNGTKPVYIKSYYESGFGSLAQPFDWITDNVYQTLIDNGYNHLQVNWLFPLCCFHEYYHDGPTPSVTDLTLYQNGKASSTMRFDVWQMIERNVSWLNDKNIGLFMFLGFNGGRNGGPDWTDLSDTEKDFYVRYVVARLGPFANIAGWNYVWEVEGDTENGELGCMRLVQKYDVFNHLRTYHDEKPKYNEFNRPEYNFAGVENHRIHSDDREPEYWPTSWTHHEACLLGYVPGKPVYMVEGNALWRRYWFQHIKDVTGHTVTQAEVRQAAWGCATAAASFTWCGHTGGGDLVAHGSDGIPFFDGEDNPYRAAAKAIDLLTDIMNNKVDFYRMTPQDSLLSGHDNHSVWCLAEPGSQYLVFSASGKSFTLNVASGQYDNNLWIDAITGTEQAAPSVTGGIASNFTPPNTSTDWVLILRTKDVMGMEDKRNSDADQLPKDFVLYQNYPNPFNPSTTIKYKLQESTHVKLNIYNLAGQLLETLVNGFQTLGEHEIAWRPKGLSSGIYFYRLQASQFSETRILILQR